ncbi:hypothetical protein SAMN05444409_1974 [Epilithonimonas zeae]|uniref:Uncharacterized protein n=1 Tax=Epilithonimonas zeae TaxID=1416779 RepID=A0A1N6GPR9_9FLAO|nr:hypothetical protein SAMN05444409_1974 [Epilithonimonas zeae]
MIPLASNIISKTDLPCPKSGIWESMGNFKTTCPISKGTKMPDYCGEKIKWRLIMAC